MNAKLVTHSRHLRAPREQNLYWLGIADDEFRSWIAKECKSKRNDSQGLVAPGVFSR
jgi:hypothetical protein